MTQGKYNVYVQTDFKPVYLVSAHAMVKLNDELECSISLFPIELERVNGRIYALAIP